MRDSNSNDHSKLTEFFRPQPIAFDRGLTLQGGYNCGCSAAASRAATERLEASGILPATRLIDGVQNAGASRGLYEGSPIARQRTAYSNEEGVPPIRRSLGNPYDYASTGGSLEMGNPYDRRAPIDRSRVSPYDMSNDQAKLNQVFDQYMSQGSPSRRMQQTGNGAVVFKAGMAIDADGAPDARRIDPTGSTKTSLRYADGSSVNAREVPYIVLPMGQYKQFGIHPGDIAAVRYNGKVQFAVFADVGPRHKIGEGSMALAQALGINSSPTRGGVRGGVEYIVFPRSGDRTPGSPQRTAQLGANLLMGDSDTLLALK